jgi:microcompartment protein CcmL/EutN
MQVSVIPRVIPNLQTIITDNNRKQQNTTSKKKQFKKKDKNIEKDYDSNIQQKTKSLRSNPRAPGKKQQKIQTINLEETIPITTLGALFFRMKECAEWKTIHDTRS